MWTHTLFLLFVAFAVYAQNLTGFALALILLGLIGITDLVPLTDAANAVTVLIFVNACMFLYQRRALRLDRMLWPAVVASLFGALAGMALLTLLVQGAYEVLRMILGLSIVGCSVLLWRAARPLDSVSSHRSFVVVGGVSGVLGGLFSAAGPPLVYLMYRQPWPLARIQETLILFFGLGALLRMAILAPAGHFSADAVVLAAEAIPVVLLVTSLSAGRPAPFSQAAVKRMVCLLLVLTGAGMTAVAVSALLHRAHG
jgi:hypothetical protein